MIHACRLGMVLGGSVLSVIVACSDSPSGSTSSGGKDARDATGGTVSSGAATSSGGTIIGGTTATSGGALGGTAGLGAAGSTSKGGSTSSGGSTSAAGGSTSAAGGSTSAAGGSTSGNTGDCPMELFGMATEGSGTTGGGNATPKVVTSSDELKTLAGGTDPQVIHLSGSFGGFSIGSNKTIIGKGANTKVNGQISISGSNIILRNLTVKGGADTISSSGSHHMWLDHLDVSDGADGVIDLTRASDFATVSWSKIYYDRGGGHRLALLFGGGSTHTADRGHNNHTVHHNWFGKGVQQRMPRLLFGKGHIYNNYYNSPGNGYCIGSGSWASLLVENNYFKDVADPHRFQDGSPSYIAATGNLYVNTTGKQDMGLGGSGSNPPGPWTPTYQYTLDKAEDVPELVQRCAGPQASLLN